MMDFYATCASGQPWRETEDDYLRKFDSKMPLSVLAKTLGRTEDAVKKRLRLLLGDKSVAFPKRNFKDPVARKQKLKAKRKQSREMPDHIRDWLTG